MQDITKGFQNVTPTNQPNFLFQFLDDADTLDSIRAGHQLMRDRLMIQPGQRVLDVGCGIGHEALRLAEVVGQEGHVIGIDKSDMMIAEAQRRAASSGLPIEFRVGDAHQLDFADNSFDAIRAERVFMYLADPEQALREMVRVTRPGGRITIFDFDNDGMLVATPNAKLGQITRRLVAFNSDSLPSGPIGMRLPGLFRKAGLSDVTTDPFRGAATLWVYRKAVTGTYENAVAAGVVTAEELAEWWAYQEQADAAGEFLAYYAGFTVSGRKV